MIYQRTVNVLIRLRGCASWYGPSLPAYTRRRVLVWRGPNDNLTLQSYVTDRWLDNSLQQKKKKKKIVLKIGSDFVLRMSISKVHSVFQSRIEHCWLQPLWISWLTLYSHSSSAIILRTSGKSLKKKFASYRFQNGPPLKGKNLTPRASSIL